MPIVRPMPFADRKDKNLEDLWDQHLFGPHPLGGAVWQVGRRSRDVYLPKGKWRNYWDRSQKLKGPRTITMDVPLGEISVFVRAGAKVPGRSSGYPPDPDEVPGTSGGTSKQPLRP